MDQTPLSGQTERADTWVSTMSGSSSDHGITVAHADSWAGIGTRDIADRAVREDILDDFTTVELAREAYGVVVDPKAPAPRPLRQPRTEKPVRRKAAQVNADASSRKTQKPAPAPVVAEVTQSPEAEAEAE